MNPALLDPVRAFSEALSRVAAAMSEVAATLMKAFERFISSAYAAVRSAVRIVPREQVMAIQIECCYRVARLRSRRVASGEGAGGFRAKRRAAEIDAEVLDRIESLASDLRVAESWFDSAAEHVDGLSNQAILRIAESSGYLDILMPELVVCEVMAC